MASRSLNQVYFSLQPPSIWTCSTWSYIQIHRLEVNIHQQAQWKMRNCVLQGAMCCTRLQSAPRDSLQPNVFPYDRLYLFLLVAGTCSAISIGHSPCGRGYDLPLPRARWGNNSYEATTRFPGGHSNFSTQQVLRTQTLQSLVRA